MMIMKANIRAALLLAVLASFLGCRETAQPNAAPIQAYDDNTLLALVLREEFSDGEYTIVSPYASIDGSLADEYFMPVQVEGYEIWPLIERLVEKNKHPTRLTLESSCDDGYVVDYEDEHERYFSENGGGWEKWREDNPSARGLTTVSLPLYDDKTGYLLVYIATTSHYLAGRGDLNIFRLVDGRPKMVGRIMLWVS